MPELRGGPVHKYNPAIPEPYRPYYEYYEHDEECEVTHAREQAVATKAKHLPETACSCEPRYVGAYVVTSVQQKSRVVRLFLWHEGYEPGGKSERKQLGAGDFLRLRRQVLQGPL